MRRGKVFLGLAMILGLSDPAANASIVNLAPASEAYIVHTADGALIGPFAPIGAGLLVGTINGRKQSGDLTGTLANEARGVAEFDLGGLFSATVNSASLSFVVHNPVDFGATGGCFDLLGCPPVAGLNFASFAGTGTVNLTDFNTGTSFVNLSPQPAYNLPVELDVTDPIRDLLLGKSAFPSFRMTALSGLDGAIGIDDLTLHVDFALAAVPEPAPILVLLPLLLALFLWIRRCDNTTR